MVCCKHYVMHVYSTDQSIELSIAPEHNQRLVPQYIRAGLVARDSKLDIDSPDFKPLTRDAMMARLD